MGPCKVCLGSGTTGNPCEGCGAGLGERAAAQVPTELEPGNPASVEEIFDALKDVPDLLPGDTPDR